jgi:hypothetical protein
MVGLGLLLIDNFRTLFVDNTKSIRKHLNMLLPEIFHGQGFCLHFRISLHAAKVSTAKVQDKFEVYCRLGSLIS